MEGLSGNGHYVTICVLQWGALNLLWSGAWQHVSVLSSLQRTIWTPTPCSDHLQACLFQVGAETICMATWYWVGHLRIIPPAWMDFWHLPSPCLPSEFYLKLKARLLNSYSNRCVPEKTKHRSDKLQKKKLSHTVFNATNCFKGKSQCFGLVSIIPQESSSSTWMISFLFMLGSLHFDLCRGLHSVFLFVIVRLYFISTLATEQTIWLQLEYNTVYCGESICIFEHTTLVHVTFS